MLADMVGEYRRYRLLGEGALAQVGDDALNHVPSPEGNSIAMIVRHLGGNLVSRFTGFLTEDGEKPWRDRESEFEPRTYTRAETEEQWRRGWAVLEGALAELDDARMTDAVRIRGQSLTVHEALARSLAHAAYHVGQMVLLARMTTTGDWRSLSIPRGESAAYNLKPDREKGHR
jgi:hypothetical protein